MHRPKKALTKMTPDIDVTFADGIDCDEKNILSIIDASIDQAIKTAKLEFAEDAELSVLIADDTTLQTLNREWRNKDKPTNVLSFPTQVSRLGKIDFPMLGDIVVSLETTQNEANLENKTLNHHLTHLIIHGFLHLFGYDHEIDSEANQMESLETKILEALGIADPYQV